jgi:predicted dehydrogenase
MVSVAVIGLGRIGAAYDAGRPSSLPRSHVGAILANSNLVLAGVCDSDQAQRDQFVRQWGDLAPVFDSVEALLAAKRYDIVAVASPTSTHLRVLAQCFAANPRVIFCEKPMGSNASEAAEIVASSRDRGIPVVVNYHRRWDCRIREFETQIRAAGVPQLVELIYVKGLRNYGSHAIDLLQQLFGPVRQVDPIGIGASTGVVEEQSLSARLTHAGGVSSGLVGVHGLDYELFDLDMYFPTQRYRLEFGGQKLWRAEREPDAMVAGYVALGELQPILGVAPVHGLTAAYRELARYVLSGILPDSSTAQSALNVQQVMDAIERAARDGVSVQI